METEESLGVKEWGGGDGKMQGRRKRMRLKGFQIREEWTSKVFDTGHF